MARPIFVYVVWNQADGLCKIGYTSNVSGRISSIQSEVGGDIKLIHRIATCSVESARNVERFLHLEFAEKRVYGEWFALSVWDAARIVSPREGDPLNEIHPLRHGGRVGELEASRTLGVPIQRLSFYVKQGLLSTPPPFNRWEIEELATQMEATQGAVIM